ncbi:MAG: HD domain-containing protein [Kiritimatiellae bacterium]|nr:HD domain-containing protein [Kiritimatiellia bacterium]
MPQIQILADMYGAYVDTFRGADGKLPPMMQLKREHTAHVVENARLIAAGEAFAPDVAMLCGAAALLHDAGRYEQLRRYNTFRDSDSVDHAVFSHDIVVENGWLASWPQDGRQSVLDAVLFHNRRDLPDGLDAVTLAVAQTVRDADKLDIFRVLEHQIATTDWRHNCEAFWNLPTRAAPNPAVVSAIRAGQPVAYQDIRTLADFVLIQVGWMRSGLAYGTTRKICAERGHLAFRRDFLRQLTDDPAVDELCGTGFRTCAPDRC